jgi:uncharacterized Tic20 family protein
MMLRRAAGPDGVPAMNAAQDAYSPSPPPPEAATLTDPHAQEWERTYATFQHLSLLAEHFLMPVIPALVMWLIKRERSPFIDDHGKETVNFQLSLVLYYFIGLITLKACIGVPILIATYVLGLVGMVMGAVAASKGRYFRYPACIRIIH